MIGQGAATGSLSVAAPFGAGTSAQRAVRVFVVQIGSLISGETLPTPSIGGVPLTPLGTQFAIAADQGIARSFGLLGATIPGSSPTVAISGANVNRRLQMWVLGWEGVTQITDGAITSQTNTPVSWTIADGDSDADTIVDIPISSTHQTSAGGNPWTSPPAIAGANGSTVVDQASIYTGCNRQLVVQEDAASTGATVLGLAYTDSQFTSSESIGPTYAVKGVTGSDTTPPTITGPGGATGGTAAATITAGATAVYTYAANETVTWDLNGGANAGLFSINSSTGALAYSSPAVAGTHVVVVRATDTASNATSQTLTVTVNAAPSGGTITSSPLARNTGAGATDAWALWDAGEAFTAWVHHRTTGALLVKRTGLLANASSVISFTDVAVPVAAAYRVDYEHEATGVLGVEVKPAT